MNIKLKKIYPYVKNADKYLALTSIALGIIASIIVFYININLVPAPIAVAVFSFLYLLNRDYDLKNLNKVHYSHDKLKIFFIITFILINLSFISFIFRPELYSRPLIYFILISIVSGILMYSILYLPPNKNYEYMAMFSIIVISFSLRITPQLLFPNLVGIDPWFHRATVNSILNGGHLVDGFVYSRLPSMHILITETLLLTGLNYKFSSVVAVAIPQIISLILIYLIGKIVFNPKVGLSAALLLCLSANYISLGFWIHPTAFALVISTFLFYLLIREEKHPSAINASIKILFGFLIVTTHMQVAFAIAIVLICFWIGKKVFNKMKTINLTPIYNNAPKYIFIIFFIVLMYSWWLYVANNLELPTRLTTMALQHDSSHIAVVGQIKNIPYYQYLLNVMPYLFFYGFSIVGFFYAVSKKSNSNYLAITFSGLALLAMPFLLLESNMAGFLAERWIYAAQLFMSIPVGVGVLSLLRITPKKYFSKNLALKGILIILVISTFAFVNITNYSANIDNSELSNGSIVRSAHTQAELLSINTISDIKGNNSVYTDYLNTLPFNDDNQTYDFSKRLEEKQFSKLRGIVLIRSLITFAPVNNLDIDYNPIQKFSMFTNFDRIYDSGSDIAFLNKNSI